MGAKITIVKHLLQATPSYLIALIQHPKVIVNAINKIITNFSWNDKNGQYIKSTRLIGPLYVTLEKKVGLV